MYAHLITVVPCFVIGTIILIIKKGVNIHKVMGRIYMILMLITAVITLFIPAKVGPQFFGHFGWIHSFSVLTIYAVPIAYLAIKRGDVRSHKRNDPSLIWSHNNSWWIHFCARSIFTLSLF